MLLGDELEDSLFEDQVYQVEDEGLNKDAMTGAEITMENKEEEIPPELDGSIAEILGADPTAITQFSDDIHKDLACRLEHIATKGLSKETRKELVDKFLMPANCTKINSPSMNPEIKAAVTETPSFKLQSPGPSSQAAGTTEEPRACKSNDFSGGLINATTEHRRTRTRRSHCSIQQSKRAAAKTDNSTAIAYINRMGGIQFPHLTKIAKDIWQWCESRKIHIFASYIKSADNEIADAESRRVHPDIEWELADDAFQLITNKFGFPEMDLFASRINAKCEKYISWHKDPDAFAINAFTVPWSNLYFYAFPPFAIILKTLRKIVSDKATGVMVVPNWQAQPWYPLFKRLLISDIITLKPNQNFLISHSSNQNIQANLTLIVGVLCGQHYCDGAYHLHQ
ncbi:hypothetical protein MSG28_010205 [Choristoneura fumiferana]|uniref:Uncharacterized protein n=1 Tax=Choristoneura fumiferana TaxID=7141 RepID=A0ACC0KKF4_CHOFU|nr:hypothetical protein MSG28_010205 [Choristoneura fumiferana]